ncbi:unnamed protein product [uncultured archaeal virus]|jgi:uncharacterized membrane protein|uniref:Uncharacterized protein n=1 Tax=uncultured archaeal virus TaxID=1960247 RepID=A0ABM9HW38_9VIRU|nr:unnamed protein product [uncultured archaeal virus]CAI3524028.1 unnamed protein product [uncultured archaeal virus]CAI4043409.1 unnamed protein product [uncultured archaeal virus]
MNLLLFFQTNWSWLIYWTVTIVALVGVILNIEHDLRCFYIWSFTNAAFAIRTFFLGAFEMTVLFVIYFILALVGIYRWKIKPYKEEQILIAENRNLRAEIASLKADVESVSGGMDFEEKKISK